ncbi:MAG TPA: hypothetical protein VHX64_17690 [Caulobacteraceae bacterium]|jgi:hypothetical protein|nr:hypothetical protein [Caulobacteraceae bacterium]
MPKNLRLKGLIVCEALLRLCRLMTDHFDCDLECFVCYMAVVSANLGRLMRDTSSFSDDKPPAQEDRWPVSRRAIAASVGLPRETVRRKVMELVEKGHLVEVRGGLRAVAPALEHADNLQIVLGAIRTFERTAAELRVSDER